jgi:putative phosphoribosyl transferase
MFTDREEAGRRLGEALRRFASMRPVVLGLPRGGVVVAAPVARLLGAELDIVVVRKLGAPGHKELAIGAVADVGGPRVMVDGATAARVGADRAYIEREAAEQVAEIRRREGLYRAGRERVDLRGRCAIVVDDGIATGATVRAALRAVRAGGPSWLVLAAPVAAPESLERLRGECDETVCLLAPEHFRAVGEFYEDFAQTEDEEVVRLLGG